MLDLVNSMLRPMNSMLGLANSPSSSSSSISVLHSDSQLDLSIPMLDSQFPCRVVEIDVVFGLEVQLRRPWAELGARAAGLRHFLQPCTTENTKDCTRVWNSVQLQFSTTTIQYSWKHSDKLHLNPDRYDLLVSINRLQLLLSCTGKVGVNSNRAQVSTRFIGPPVSPAFGGWCTEI